MYFLSAYKQDIEQFLSVHSGHMLELYTVTEVFMRYVHRGAQRRG